MSPYLTGFAIPALLLLFGIVGKKVAIDGLRDWKLKDFDLGIDFAVLGVVTCLLNGFDLYKIEKRPGDRFTSPAAHTAVLNDAIDEQLRNTVCLVIAFMITVYVISEYHRREKAQNASWLRGLLGVVVDDVLGYATVVVYLLWVKGID